MSAFSVDNPVFRAFAFHATASIIKMFVMGVLTARQRKKSKAFANPEDTMFAKKGAVRLDDQDVERVRRNHLNDLENIVPFVLLGLLYVAIGPSPGIALNHFRVFFFSRLFHTIAYQKPLPQPSRAVAHLVGMAVNISMCVQILMATW